MKVKWLEVTKPLQEGSENGLETRDSHGACKRGQQQDTAYLMLKGGKKSAGRHSTQQTNVVLSPSVLTLTMLNDGEKSERHPTVWIVR